MAVFVHKKVHSLSRGMIAALMALSVLCGDLGLVTRAESFDNYDIRVIRPKYFQKRMRFELGAQLSAIMNETFVYTYMASGLMTFHINEYFAIEGNGTYGFSFDRGEKLILNEVAIKTQVFRTTYMLGGSLLITPIYGKWQLPSGRLIYFDSFFSLGGGLNGVYWNYVDFCTQDRDFVGGPENPLPDNALKGYPAFAVGFGQRYFLDKFMAIRWDIRNHSLIYNRSDTSCVVNPEPAGTAIHHNVTLQIGVSRFF